MYNNVYAQGCGSDWINEAKAVMYKHEAAAAPHFFTEC